MTGKTFWMASGRTQRRPNLIGYNRFCIIVFAAGTSTGRNYRNYSPIPQQNLNMVLTIPNPIARNETWKTTLEPGLKGCLFDTHPSLTFNSIQSRRIFPSSTTSHQCNRLGRVSLLFAYRLSITDFGWFVNGSAMLKNHENIFRYHDALVCPLRVKLLESCIQNAIYSLDISINAVCFDLLTLFLGHMIGNHKLKAEEFYGLSCIIKCSSKVVGLVIREEIEKFHFFRSCDRKWKIRNWAIVRIIIYYHLAKFQNTRPTVKKIDPLLKGISERCPQYRTPSDCRDYQAVQP